MEMKQVMRLIGLVLLVVVALPGAARGEGELRVLTKEVPFPRGLALADPDGDGEASLYVLSRGRSRGDGGADTGLDDQAGTLWEVDPATGQTRVFVRPTSPPFRLLDRTLPRATDDEQTDRPYCVLRWDEATRSFYICGFSGIDLPATDEHGAESGYFRKNRSDVVLRYDVGAKQWSEVDRHEPADGDAYPGEAGGYVRGPDNLAVVADGQLVVAAKENDRLVLYDVLGDATPRVVMTDRVTLMDGMPIEVRGHSALAVDGDWLYVGFRTTGQVVRVPIVREHAEDGRVLVSLATDRAELLALFQPFDHHGPEHRPRRRRLRPLGHARPRLPPDARHLRRLPRRRRCLARPRRPQRQPAAQERKPAGDDRRHRLPRQRRRLPRPHHRRHRLEGHAIAPASGEDRQ